MFPTILALALTGCTETGFSSPISDNDLPLRPGATDPGDPNSETEIELDDDPLDEDPLDDDPLDDDPLDEDPLDDDPLDEDPLDDDPLDEDEEPDEDDLVAGTGRMTGGGSVFEGDIRVTHGFTLRCETRHNDNLQINWEGHSFHATDIDWIACYDDADLDPSQPSSTLDTVVGQATGRLDGVDGAVVEFLFTDDGEPGTTDEAEIAVFAADGSLQIEAANVLEFGNHQAHGEADALPVDESLTSTIEDGGAAPQAGCASVSSPTVMDALIGVLGRKSR